MDDDIHHEIRRLQKGLEDLRYDIRKELLEMAQLWREDLYDIRIRLQRLEDHR